jgi:xanthine/uracil permease
MTSVKPPLSPEREPTRPAEPGGNSSAVVDAREFRRYLVGGLVAGAAYPCFQLYYYLLARGIPWAWNHRLLLIGAATIAYLFGLRAAGREGRHPVWLYSWAGSLLYAVGLLATESDATVQWTPHVTAAACLIGTVIAAACCDGVAAMLIPIAWILWLVPRVVLASSVHPWSVVILQNFLSVAVGVLVFMHAVTPSNGRRAVVAALAASVVLGFTLITRQGMRSGADPGSHALPEVLTAVAFLLLPLAIGLARHLIRSAAGSAKESARRFLTDQSLARAKSY